jgi:RNA polymerase sigma-70 factor (ECF subfamily)
MACQWTPAGYMAVATAGMKGDVTNARRRGRPRESSRFVRLGTSQARGYAVLGIAFADTLERARAGDEAAFALLFRDLQPALIRYLRVMTRSAAEDLAAETWFDVVKGLARFSGDEARFRSWIFTIARRRQIDAVRAMARRPVAVWAEDAEPPDPGPEDGVALAAEENSALESALRTIARLPPAQAEVVMLRAVAGLSVAEVAGAVGRRPGAVRILAHRGLRRLAEELFARPGPVEV